MGLSPIISVCPVLFIALNKSKLNSFKAPKICAEQVKPINKFCAESELLGDKFCASRKTCYILAVKSTVIMEERIDFLLSRSQKICPIEVKSSGYKAHKSLDLFCEKYSDRIRERYLLYTKDLRKEQQIIMLPVYMTPLM